MSEVKKEIIKNLIALRKEKGIQQKELAEQINSKKSTVACWETERAMPDYEMLYKICKVLNISISELFGKYSNDKNMFNDLTVEEKEKVKTFIEFLKSQRNK
ncbi:helix-turn-helix transcriptional regulator [bacterium]|nr:helix-turn-helix transcriptional regulator [bacterium]